uniref:DDE-1 domain-containing protein n=1 Tax=Trichuris muris TaxID=70415 RepID=A0A5S6Q763_TRIMR
MKSSASPWCFPVLADGTKLKPMVIFKRKRKPNVNFPHGALVHFHENAWMDEAGVRLWIDKIWRKRPGHANNSSLLIWDSFRSHTTEVIKNHLKECKVQTAVIPGGLTSILQPLDVCLNKPFKDYLREEWNEWMTNGQKYYTRGGCMRAPSLQTLCQFVINAWCKVKTETVIKSFKKCPISNALDGTEDDALWEQSDCEGGTDALVEQHTDDDYIFPEDIADSPILQRLPESSSDESDALSL